MRWKAFAAAVLAAVLIAPATAQQQQQQQQPAEQQARSTILNVNAQGVSAARPDMATLNIGVTTQATTAQAAMADNARRMTALLQTLRRAGVAERDIQSSWVRLNPRYDGSEQARIIGYHATNSVRAIVRSVENTGPVIDAVVGAGANQIHGISFARQDADAQLDLARRDAVTVARQRAELYASALGLRVVRVISVTEAGASQPSFDEIVVTGRRIGGADTPTPIAPGEMETRANVSVAFELR